MRFQAIATAAADPGLTMLGIAVNTAPISNNNFLDVNGVTISRSAFFSAVATGDKLVKVRGTLNIGSGPISWNREAELED